MQEAKDIIEIKEADTAANVGAHLEAIDREIAFFRHRAGQVYFFGLLAEVLIIIGKESITIPDIVLWLRPVVATVFFAAVAYVGILLGSEYRRRIRHLKKKRDALLRPLLSNEVFLSLNRERISEIQILYFVLGFCSLLWISISWLNTFPCYASYLTVISVGIAALIGGGFLTYSCLRKSDPPWFENDEVEKVSIKPD